MSRPAFERRHIEAIAEILNDMPCQESRGVGTYASPITHATYHALSMVESFACLFAEMNPHFYRSKFITACGFEPWDELIMGQPFMRCIVSGCDSFSDDRSPYCDYHAQFGGFGGI